MSHQSDTDTLARTLWGEARGEGRAGMEAVASVILNRAWNPKRWPNDVTGVCKERLQFSCWNPNDNNLQKLLAVTANDAQFAEALEIATIAMAGELEDPTGGADHYHTRSIRPKWADNDKLTALIGNHVFYKLA